MKNLLHRSTACWILSSLLLIALPGEPLKLQEPAKESGRSNSTVSQSGQPEDSQIQLPTIAEARQRAKILHDTIHGVLQVTHRDFFDPDDLDKIPSGSLEDVFEDLAKNHGVQLRWLGVDGKTMNIDHRPRDEFEKMAVESLSSNQKEYEAVEGQLYRRAAGIRLHNTCLKCHVPNRVSLEDRTAGLVISMPVRQE